MKFSMKITDSSPLKDSRNFTWVRCPPPAAWMPRAQTRSYCSDWSHWLWLREGRVCGGGTGNGGGDGHSRSSWGGATHAERSGRQGIAPRLPEEESEIEFEWLKCIFVLACSENPPKNTNPGLWIYCWDIRNVMKQMCKTNSCRFVGTSSLCILCHMIVTIFYT